MSLRAGILALTFFAVILVAGSCGGQEEAPVEGLEETTLAETTTEEIVAGADSEQTEDLRLSCQLMKAEEDGFDTEALATEIGEAIAAETFADQVPPEELPTPDPEVKEALEEGKTMADILEDEGYTCTDEEAREMAAEAEEQADQALQEAQEAQAELGINEAGQDVSNIPVLSPEEQRAEAECLNEYYLSLPPDQRGAEQQRVVAEANERGVTPGAVVGCDREAGLSAEELDRIHEQPNPSHLQQQCSPESNASPAFREQYC